MEWIFILKRWESIGSKVLRTDKLGDIVIATDGNNLIVNDDSVSIDSNNNNTANLVSNDLLTNKIKQVSILYKNSLNKINTSKSDIPIYNTIKKLTKRIIVKDIRNSSAVP